MRSLSVTPYEQHALPCRHRTVSPVSKCAEHVAAMNGLVLFAHGARDPQWAAPFQRLSELVAAQRPGWQVSLAYLELMTPSLAEAVSAQVEAGASRITIAPLFLGPGGHLRRDFPILMDELRVRYPNVGFDTLPALGESDTLLAAIADWLTASLPG
ncbi:MAG: sirohydrochlorin chelatase [Sulfuriferula sp.]